LNKEKKILKREDILLEIAAVLENGYCYEDKPLEIMYPTTQKQIVKYFHELDDIAIVQATVSGHLKTLNYHRDATGKYVKRNKHLYAEHRELLLQYLKLGNYTLKSLSKSKENALSINTKNLNTELLYELIKESYPEGHVQYMIKGYNILRVVIDKDYQYPPAHDTFPSFLDDIRRFAKKPGKPKVLKKTRISNPCF